EWHRIVFRGRLAEIAGEYLKKGSPVYVEGRIRTRKWQDKEGQDRYTTEIMADNMQLLGSRAGAGEPVTAREPAEAAAGRRAAKPGGKERTRRRPRRDGRRYPVLASASSRARGIGRHQAPERSDSARERGPRAGAHLQRRSVRARARPDDDLRAGRHRRDG